MNKLIPTFVILKLILFTLCQYSGSLQNVGLFLFLTWKMQGNATISSIQTSQA